MKRKVLSSSPNLKGELHYTLNPTIKVNEKKAIRYNHKNNNDKQLKQKDNSRDIIPVLRSNSVRLNHSQVLVVPGIASEMP